MSINFFKAVDSDQIVSLNEKQAKGWKGGCVGEQKRTVRKDSAGPLLSS